MHKTIYEMVKGRETYEVTEEQTVLEVARLMVEQNIGAVPVCRDGDLVGIFSERDVLRRVVAEARDPSQVRVSEVMSGEVITVAPHESVQNCMLLMKQRNFRHLPVCDGKRLVGMISLRDLLLHDLTEKDDELQLMRAYVQTAS